MRLCGQDYDEIDAGLAGHDAFLRARYPGERAGRQPVHTVYVPADRLDDFRDWGAIALRAMDEHDFPWPDPAVRAKLAREPIEDLRVDFEDGYGVRDDDQEDAAVRRAAAILAAGPRPPFLGIRIKSLEAATRRRSLRTLDLFLDTYQDLFTVTLPKVSGPDQVTAMVTLCEKLEKAYGLSAGAVTFEIQVELPSAVLAADGTVTVARLITAAGGRCTGLHYGTYDYSAAAGVAAAYQSMEHPVADYAKAVMQAAAAQTGVRLSDGSTNILPVGGTAQVREAWELHRRLVRRSLERGYYQGWDLHPAQLPTRYAATYEFFRDGRDTAVTRLRRYLDRQDSGIADEPATARALAGYLLRGLDCGALDDASFPRAELTALT
ncbi:citrate lyase beta subunit [Actinoplanes campanulatus]|uniref:Citrate lyase beta subunit n=1 Tax=Actinoplanes campanulatus TaxID=113559 RepID=A0A7W5FBR4_9ACTN|nr:aldolase/citrate lyase family protein [Actinoplanes campanulatus]MBB3092517.1 citrate lyase beta subunit [Actinoplanes campanulatus]GGM97070.1 aldolase [Actinoplanes campanulatus]GID34389.1 aldolase [Actinoplanes campanulatus]